MMEHEQEVDVDVDVDVDDVGSNTAEEATNARATAEAVLRLAERRETPQSPIKKWNARLSATRDMIAKDFQEEMLDLSQQLQSEMGTMNRDFKYTKDQIGIVLDKARSRMSLKQTSTSTTASTTNNNKIDFTEGAEEAASDHGSNEETKNDNEVDKQILSDLDTLELKITHCGLLMASSGTGHGGNGNGNDDDHHYDSDSDDEGPPGDEKEQMMLAAIGFLEACVDRMDELVEAGMDGALLPETLEVTLVTRERLHLMLERCESPYAASFVR
jgi:hypothetical protein